MFENPASIAERSSWQKWDLHQSGLTLVELVVVLAVLSVMTTLLWPTISSVAPGHQIKTTARQMVNEIKIARSQ